MNWSGSTKPPSDPDVDMALPGGRDSVAATYGVLIAGLGELIEDARGTAILGGTHVLTDRLGVEHAVTTLRQQHETEHLPTVA